MYVDGGHGLFSVAVYVVIASAPIISERWLRNNTHEVGGCIKHTVCLLPHIRDWQETKHAVKKVSLISIAKKDLKNNYFVHLYVNRFHCFVGGNMYSYTLTELMMLILPPNYNICAWNGVVLFGGHF